jgi:hypothetical protein
VKTGLKKSNNSSAAETNAVRDRSKDIQLLVERVCERIFIHIKIWKGLSAQQCRRVSQQQKSDLQKSELKNNPAKDDGPPVSRNSTNAETSRK